MLECAENKILQFHQNQGNDKGRQKRVYAFGDEFFVQNAGASCHNQRTYQYAQYLFPSKHRKTSFVLRYIYIVTKWMREEKRVWVFLEFLRNKHLLIVSNHSNESGGRKGTVLIKNF